MYSQTEAAEKIGIPRASLSAYQLRGLIKPTIRQKRKGCSTLYDDDAIEKAKFFLILTTAGLNCNLASECAYDLHKMQNFISYLQAIREAADDENP